MATGFVGPIASGKFREIVPLKYLVSHWGMWFQCWNCLPIMYLVRLLLRASPMHTKGLVMGHSKDIAKGLAIYIKKYLKAKEEL